MPCVMSSTFLSSGLFVLVLALSILRMVSTILEGRPKCLSLWWNFCRAVWFQEFSSSVWNTLFLFFLSSPLVWWCLLPIFLSTWNFPFLQAFWFFLNLVVLLLPLFVFSHFHYEHGIFSNAKFHSYTLAVYSYWLYHSYQFFLIFGKQLMTSIYIRWYLSLPPTRQDLTQCQWSEGRLL